MISKLLSLRFILLQKITKIFPPIHSFFFHLSHGKSGHVTAVCIIVCGCILTLIIGKSRVWFRFKPSWRLYTHLPSYFLEISLYALYRFTKKLWEPLLLLSSKEWSLISIHLLLYWYHIGLVPQAEKILCSDTTVISQNRENLQQWEYLKIFQNWRYSNTWTE